MIAVRKRLIRNKSYRQRVFIQYIQKSKSKIQSKKTILLLSIIPILIISAIYIIQHDYDFELEGFVKEGNYKEALAVIERRLKKDKNDSVALKNKGKIYTIYALKQDTNPTNSNTNSEKRILLQDGIKIFNRLLYRDYNTSEINFLLSINFFLHGEEQYDRALFFLSNAIKANKKDGLIKDYVSGDKRLPLKVFGQEYFFTLYGLGGYLSFALNNYKESIKYLNYASSQIHGLTAREDKIIYTFYIGLCYIYLKDYENAEKSLETVLTLLETKEELNVEFKEVNKSDMLSHVYYTLSNVSYIKKDYTKSKAYIKEAINLKPSTTNYYQIGLVYEATNNLRKAFASWQKALELDPDNSKARQRVIRFEERLKGK